VLIAGHNSAAGRDVRASINAGTAILARATFSERSLICVGASIPAAAPVLARTSRRRRTSVIVCH